MQGKLDAVCFVEMRISPSHSCADLYFVLLQYCDEVTSDAILKPLLEEGLLAAFVRKDDIPDALSRVGISVDSALEKYSVIIDYANALYRVHRADVDEDADILNTLNILSDLFGGLNISVSPRYKDALNDLVRHVTFDNQLDTYFEGKPEAREVCYDGLLWCLGAIIANSVVRS